MNDINIEEIKLKISKICEKRIKSNSDEFGEVYTPFYLIEKMVSLIPETFFKSPDIKILDNSVGKGNFTIILIEKLLKYHSYEHIIKNMLYFCDIQEESKLFLNEIFGKVNFYLGSFLNDDFDKYFNNIHFDLTIGNPPYNNKRDKNTNGNILWDKFVLKSYEISDRLCFVHPSLWRKPLNKKSNVIDILNLFKKGNLKYLNINSSKEGLKVFNAGTSFDYYYFEKNTKYQNTIVNDIDNNETIINISNFDFIPNKNFYLIKKYLGNTEVIFNSKYHAVRDYVSKEKDENFKYPLIHSTPNKGIVYRYSKINNKGHYGVKKIIFGESGYKNYIVDEKGLYGMTQGAMGVVYHTDEEKEKIINFLESVDFKLIIDSCKWSNFRIDANFIRKLNILNS